MSRSRRKNPFCGITVAKSEKRDKALVHRAWRVAQRVALRAGRDVPVQRLPYMSKDGKQRIDPDEFPGIMRK